MSLKAMIWVMEQAPTKNHAELAILYALADRAGDDGANAWPSIAWIAERARCSTRTVQRHLKAMESRGLIKQGDQRAVAHIRYDRRPTVWDLNLNAGCQSVTPQDEQRGDNDDATGCQPRHHGVTTSASRGDRAVSPKPSLTIQEPSKNQPPVVPQGDTPPKPTRGERLPDNWMPTDDVIQAMRKENPTVNLEREHAKFTDHWLAASGANARKRDWNAAWRNWIRRAADNYPQHQPTNTLDAWGAPSTQQPTNPGAPGRAVSELTW